MSWDSLYWDRQFSVLKLVPPGLTTRPGKRRICLQRELPRSRFTGPTRGDEQTERLPDTSEIDTPTRMQTSLLRNNGEYDWRAPVKEAILDQAAGANIDPVLLQLSIQEPPGDSVRLQNLIDQDLLELLPPAERNVRRVQTSQQRQVAQSSRAKRRAAYSRIQALYKSSRTSCAKVVLAGKWREVAPTLSMQEQVAFWKPLLETPSAPDRRPPPQLTGHLNGTLLSRFRRWRWHGTSGVWKMERPDQTIEFAVMYGSWEPSRSLARRRGIETLPPDYLRAGLVSAFSPKLGRADWAALSHLWSSESFQEGRWTSWKHIHSSECNCRPEGKMSLHQYRLPGRVQGVRLRVARIYIPGRGIGRNTRPARKVYSVGLYGISNPASSERCTQPGNLSESWRQTGWPAEPGPFQFGNRFSAPSYW